MWWLKKIIILLLIFIIVLTHLILRDWLEYPLNYFNLTFLFLSATIIIWPQKNNLWLVIPTMLLIEIFSVKPFGINTISLFLSLLITNWLLLNIITNRSILIVLFSGIFSLTLYRLFYYLLLLANQLIEHGGNLIWSEIVLNWLWECTTTISVLVLFYIITNLFTKRFNPSYIVLDHKNIF